MKIDLHIHSCYSYDSLSRPKDIIKTAIKNKIKILAVTDHNTIKGGLATYQENKKYNYDCFVIIGSEIHTNIGDIIGLFLNSEIKSTNIGEVIDEINDQGGIIILPHPFKHHDLTNLKFYLNKIEFVELLNSRSPINAEEMKIIHSYNKKELGSSDAHFNFEIGKCYTSLDIPYTPSTNESIISMLRNNQLTARGTFSKPFIEKSSQIIKKIKLFYR